MRIDPEGRDITEMPGLHDDESDTIVDDAFAASVIVHFGGVGACGKAIYLAKQQAVAAETNRRIDDVFRHEMRQVLRTLPCPLD